MMQVCQAPLIRGALTRPTNHLLVQPDMPKQTLPDSDSHNCVLLPDDHPEAQALVAAGWVRVTERFAVPNMFRFGPDPKRRPAAYVFSHTQGGQYVYNVWLNGQCVVLAAPIDKALGSFAAHLLNGHTS